MFRTRDMWVYPDYDKQEYDVNNAKTYCDTSPDISRLHHRWALRSSLFNQVQLRRCTRQRDTLQPTISTITTSRDNSYTRPNRRNRIRSIATSTITIHCSQLSSTKQCRDGGWRKRLYYPLTHMTEENPTRSYQMMIFVSTWLYCTIKVRLRRNGFLQTKSSYRYPLHDESWLTEKLSKLTYDENQYIVIGYSMSAYHFDQYPLQ
jgi:hypothetical protein